MTAKFKVLILKRHLFIVTGFNWNFLIYWSAITNLKILRELGRGENDVKDSLKQWFAGSAQSRGLRKPGCGRCYLRFFIV